MNPDDPPLTPEAWRAGFRDRLRGPMDPEDDDTDGADHIARAIHMTAGVCTAAGFSAPSGMPLADLSLYGPAAVAAGELEAYVRDLVHAETHAAYNRGCEDGYTEGKADGQAEELHRLGMTR